MKTVATLGLLDLKSEDGKMVDVALFTGPADDSPGAVMVVMEPHSPRAKWVFWAKVSIADLQLILTEMTRP